MSDEEPQKKLVLTESIETAVWDAFHDALANQGVPQDVEVYIQGSVSDFQREMSAVVPLTRSRYVDIGYVHETLVQRPNSYQARTGRFILVQAGVYPETLMSRQHRGGATMEFFIQYGALAFSVAQASTRRQDLKEIFAYISEHMTHICKTLYQNRNKLLGMKGSVPSTLTADISEFFAAV